MLLSSSAFFVFFLGYVCLHLALPARRRVYLVIAGSTIFYAWWRVEYVWIPYLLTAVAYVGVRWMERAAAASVRKRRAAVVIGVLFLPLVFFKYTDFLYRDVVGPVAGLSGTLLNLPLPLGVSFITFTLTAYVVDIYRRRFPADHRPSTLLAYVLFFPHLTAGPILRPHELIPQFERPRRRALRRFTAPLAIFTIGLVKKLVFADQISGVVDATWQSATVSAPMALVAMYGFSMQIYCDFSGYTDMAIGVALMLGVRLPNNFLQPYAARSLTDFWRRWHITLSSWLRDYLYVPLGGNRHGELRTIRNIVITMALGGLWHGASWTFVVWGLFQGIGVSLVHAVRRVWRSAALPAWLGVALTFHFVTVGWVFFRAPTLRAALRMLAMPWSGGGWDRIGAFAAQNAFALLLLGLFAALHRFDDHRRIRLATIYVPREILWPAILLLWIVAVTVSQGSSAKFIYFDF